jgi:hypothetical protein
VATFATPNYKEIWIKLYEFYPALGETVSLRLFYKLFQNPIERTFIDLGGSLRYQYENAHKDKSMNVNKLPKAITRDKVSQ